MARGRKKGAPKRNTVHQNALYAPRKMPGLAIGARCDVGLPSETGFYDGDAGAGIMVDPALARTVAHPGPGNAGRTCTKIR